MEIAVPILCFSLLVLIPAYIVVAIMHANASMEIDYYDEDGNLHSGPWDEKKAKKYSKVLRWFGIISLPYFVIFGYYTGSSLPEAYIRKEYFEFSLLFYLFMACIACPVLVVNYHIWPIKPTVYKKLEPIAIAIHLCGLLVFVGYIIYWLWYWFFGGALMELFDGFESVLWFIVTIFAMLYALTLFIRR